MQTSYKRLAAVTRGKCTCKNNFIVNKCTFAKMKFALDIIRYKFEKGRKIN